MSCCTLFCVIGNFVPITQKRSAGMRTVAYNVDAAGARMCQGTFFIFMATRKMIKLKFQKNEKYMLTI